MPHLENAIRERAYHLWLADGCRDGAADAYWLSAQREVLSASQSNTATAPALPEAAVAKTKAPAKAKAAKAAASKVAPKAAAPAKAKRRAA